MTRPIARLLPATLAILLLAACSQPPEPEVDAGSTDTPAKAATRHHATPLDTMLKTEDRARGVEDTLKQADDQRRKTLDEAGG